MGLGAQKAIPSRDFNAMIIQTDGATQGTVLGEGGIAKEASQQVSHSI